MVTIAQGRNLVNPNVTSEAIEPLTWFKFFNFNERWTAGSDSHAPEWNSQ